MKLPSLERREIRRLHEFEFDAVFDRQRAAGLFFGCFLGLNPFGILAEGVEGGIPRIDALMSENVKQGDVGSFREIGILLILVVIPIADVGHAVLFEELAGVIAKTSV